MSTRRGAEDIVLRLEMHDYVFDLYLLGSASAPQIVGAPATTGASPSDVNPAGPR
jgi:hypothetical protein